MLIAGSRKIAMTAVMRMILLNFMARIVKRVLYTHMARIRHEYGKCRGGFQNHTLSRCHGDFDILDEEVDPQRTLDVVVFSASRCVPI